MSSIKQLDIIIADDHNFFRSGLEAVLKSFSYVKSVSQAGNGEQLIELLGKNKYDIAFVDIGMPVINGIEAVKIISTKFPSLKVIALSMHDDRESILEMMNNGAMAYILKNTDKEEIDEAIKVVLSGHQYFSNAVSTVLYEELVAKVKKPESTADSELLHKERFREIIFLLCHELKNSEIGDVLFLATSTIESYRKDAIHTLGCKTTAGLIKYGVESGLYKDSLLLEKFKQVVEAKREEE